jgi:fumarate reductase flavoprotein subunit
MANRAFDVIVVGAGTAGLPAAICAADRGLRVGLVEAAGVVGGTLHLSTASISAAGTSIQARHGVVDSAELHYDDCMRINRGTGDAKLLAAWTQGAAEMIEWLLSIGWSCDPDAPVLAPEHDLYAIPRTYRSTDQGFGLIDAFKRQLDRGRQQGNIELLLNTRMRSLVHKDGAVGGIVVERDSGLVELNARAVILTTGGYTASERHWRDIHGMAPLRYFRPTVLGDGLEAVSDIGGYYRFSEHVLPTFGGTRDIDSPDFAWIYTVILPSIRPPWEIYVNASGERFMAEDEPSIDARERALMKQPEWFFWCIFDQAIHEQSPKFFRWSDGQVAELFARGGDYVIADTLEELAAKCAMPPNALFATVANYNRGQAAGQDSFGRRAMPLPISGGPYYAVKHYGISICSAAGLAVNADLAPVRQDGSPIDGLYAAGEVIGVGFLGNAFLSGSIVSAAVTFGRQLGQRVLA